MDRWTRQEGWDQLSIKNGGKITIESGGIVDILTGGEVQFDGVAAPAPWTGAIASAAEINSLMRYPGVCAVAVVDFNTGAAEALCSITIDGVVYQEADPAVPAGGVWTNGASAANSATSFAAAVNGDVRPTAVPFTAIVAVNTESVVLCADAVGIAGNVVITTTSAARVTVENAHGGTAPALKRVAVVAYVVTAQDVLADEVNIPLPFTATAGVFNYRHTTGEQFFPTCLPSFQAAPARCRALFAGATDPIAGDYICALVME